MSTITTTANGNTSVSDGPELRRSYVWNADNQPTRIDKQGGGAGVTEDYLYGADGERVKRTQINRKTFYLEGLWEETRQDGPNGATSIRLMYILNGQVVAQREVHPHGPTYSSLQGESYLSTNSADGIGNHNLVGIGA